MTTRRLRDNAYKYPMPGGFMLTVSRVYKGIDSIERAVEWQYHIHMGVNSIARAKGFPTKREAKKAGMEK